MKIGLLVLDFHLEACFSLKEKRHRLSCIRDKIGKQAIVAVCESGHHDSLESSQWAFLAISTSGKIVDKTLSEIEEYIDMNIDAQIVNSKRYNL
ncbi:MAG: DUF503 domain-containing protein [bacterium]